MSINNKILVGSLRNINETYELAWEWNSEFIQGVIPAETQIV